MEGERSGSLGRCRFVTSISPVFSTQRAFEDTSRGGVGVNCPPRTAISFPNRGWIRSWERVISTEYTGDSINGKNTGGKSIATI